MTFSAHLRPVLIDRSVFSTGTAEDMFNTILSKIAAKICRCKTISSSMTLIFLSYKEVYN